MVVLEDWELLLIKQTNFMVAYSKEQMHVTANATLKKLLLCKGSQSTGQYTGAHHLNIWNSILQNCNRVFQGQWAQVQKDRVCNLSSSGGGTTLKHLKHSFGTAIKSPYVPSQTSQFTGNSPIPTVCTQ